MALKYLIHSIQNIETVTSARFALIKEFREWIQTEKNACYFV
uniref:Uncharacterized protein n=1 Tax=Candidatus Kentrum sp. FM TaxID=2126340 RepID=A0A450T5P6_9GAMM|nr:MAG: hypothetical protein BECKFM1743A_GA0114220_102936 [Candidatus Kentron sp. FM]